MKVAYVHSGYWPSNSPSFTFVTSNAIGMSSEFKEIYLYVKNNSKDSSENIIQNNFNVSKPDNIFIERIEHKPIIKTNFIYYNKVLKILKEKITIEKLDVIITRNPTFLKYLVILKNEYGVKVYFESHDFYADLSVRDDIKKGKKKRIEKIENRYIPKIDGVICLQNSQKKNYENIFSSGKFYIARTGLQKVENINEEKKYVTYIGSLDKHKGILQLLKAMNKTKSKPNLLIVGGKSKTEIKTTQSLVQEHYNPNLVKITGWVGKDELKNYLKKTAIGVIPLTETFFNKFITSPLKLFDYYSYCIPVIATDLPTTRELIVEGKTGYFFKNEHYKELAERIDELYPNEKIIDKMRLEINNFAQSFLWKNRAIELIKIFKNTAN